LRISATLQRTNIKKIFLRSKKSAIPQKNCDLFRLAAGGNEGDAPSESRLQKKRPSGEEPLWISRRKSVCQDDLENIFDRLNAVLNVLATAREQLS
jgi:hypothetical protein